MRSRLGAILGQTRAERFPLALLAFTLGAQIMDTVTTYNLFFFNTPRGAANSEINPALAHSLQTPMPVLIKLIFVPLLTYLALTLLIRRFQNPRFISPCTFAVLAVILATAYTVAIAICNAQLPH